MSESFDPNYKQVPITFRVGQKVVVFNDEEKILFLRRSLQAERAGGWDFPGGGLENEEPEEGIRREAREEAHIELDQIRPTGFITHDDEAPNTRLLLIGYAARLASGTVELSWEHDEYVWHTVQDALQVDLPKGHKKFLDLALVVRSELMG